MIIKKYRSFNTPNPEARYILDSISNFIDGINRSLRLGTVRQGKFSVEFRTDVFKALFDGKGETAKTGRGCLYRKDDFDSRYFPPSWYQCWDRLGDGCEVEFPIQLHSHIRYSPLCFTLDTSNTPIPKLRSFSEILSVSVIKRRC